MRDCFLWFLLIAVLQYFSLRVKILILLIVICYLLMKKKWIAVFVVLILFARSQISSQFIETNTIQGTVVKVYEHSFLLKTKQGNVLAVSDEQPVLDSIVLCKGELKIQEDTLAFFRTEPLSNAIMYCDETRIILERNTMRSMVHRLIESHPDEAARNLMMKSLLRCSNELDSGILASITLSFMIRTLCQLARYWLNEKHVDVLGIICTVFFSMLWGLELTAFRIFYFKAAKYIKISFYESLGLYCIMMTLYDPKMLSSSSFWFAVLIRLIFKNLESKQAALLWILAILQLCFYGDCDIVEVVLNPMIQLISLMTWILCMAALCFPISLNGWISFLQFIDASIPSFELHGTISLVSVLVLIAVISVLNRRRQLLGMMLSLVFISINLVPSVTFFNVGQGDAALIQVPYRGLTVLIDTGPPSSYVQLRNSLHAMSVYEIDLLIISHDDLDHSGNKESLTEDFYIKEVWENTSNINQYDELNMIKLNSGNENDQENDQSLILAFSLNHLNFFFPGDAGYQKEEEAVSKISDQFDICKISHHGSNTSTSSSFLDQAQCSVAIISAGLNNRYGHPHEEVIKRLENNHSVILNTQVHGDVRIVMTRFFNLITTSTHEFGIILKM